MMPRKRYEPTEEQRALVKRLAGCRLGQEQICAMVGLRSPKTLRRHFQRELSSGMVEAMTRVKKTAFQMATSGQHPQMTVYWLQTRARWSKQMNKAEQVIETFVIEPYEPPNASD